MDKFERQEYKYFVPVERLDQLRACFKMNMEMDPFCSRDESGFQYTVRSIYLDTIDHLFFYEKIDGVKVRKKLRIRSYGFSTDKNIAFIEIKRKFGNSIYKERIKTRLEDTPLIFNGGKPPLLPSDQSFLDRSILDKFLYLTKRLSLQPRILVTYEREALYGVDDSNLRVTLDKNVRSYLNPDLDMIYMENDLRMLDDSHFILEIKFNGRMPVWVRNTIRKFQLHVQPISKYCNNLETWLPTEHKVSG